MKKKILISVTSDLYTDQRVHRTAMTLYKQGHDVTLIGRQLKSSSAFAKRDYKTVRFRLWFEKGPLFYSSYNLRLFFYLLFNKGDLFQSNDLDTLLPNYIVSVFKGVPLVYDCHEYFTGVPELIRRPRVQHIWKWIERFIFPKLKFIYTVNQSIADLYCNEYNKDVKVIMNIPDVSTSNENFSVVNFRRKNNLPIDKKIIILQGAGINIDRGAEEAVEAMKYIDNAVLLIIGGGDVMTIVKKLVERFQLQSRIIFLNKMPYDELILYTLSSDLGLTLDKDTNINYQYSLPNKLFDYIHAGIPVLSSPLIEIKKIIEHYNIGCIIDSHDPKHISEKINYMLSEKIRTDEWKKNTQRAKQELNWGIEKKKLIEIFNEAFG